MVDEVPLGAVFSEAKHWHLGGEFPLRPAENLPSISLGSRSFDQMLGSVWRQTLHMRSLIPSSSLPD